MPKSDNLMPITTAQKKATTVQAELVRSVDFRLLTITPDDVTSVFANVATVDGEAVSDQSIPAVTVKYDDLPQNVQDAVNLIINALAPT